MNEKNVMNRLPFQIRAQQKTPKDKISMRQACKI